MKLIVKKRGIKIKDNTYKNFDIDKYVNSYDVNNFITYDDKYTDAKWDNMIEVFWKDPKIKKIELYNKFNFFNKKCGIINLIKSNYNEQYINFLNDVWKNKLPYKEIREKYRLHQQDYQVLVDQIKVKEEEYYCSVCGSNKYLVIRKRKNGENYFDCYAFEHLLVYNNVRLKVCVIDREHAISVSKFNYLEGYLNNLRYVREVIKEKSCPECGNKINYDVLNERNYHLECDKCSWELWY